MGEVVKSKTFPEVSGTYPHCCSSICCKLEDGSCTQYNEDLDVGTVTGLYRRCEPCILESGVVFYA